mgnify:FL=1
MARCRAAAVPKQPERGFQRQSSSAPLPKTARLQRQALRLRFASALLLTIMGQLP